MSYYMCRSCDYKSSSKFHYCPWCGVKGRKYVRDDEEEEYSLDYDLDGGDEFIEVTDLLNDAIFRKKNLTTEELKKIRSFVIKLDSVCVEWRQIALTIASIFSDEHTKH